MNEITTDKANNLLKMMLFLGKSKNYTITKDMNSGETYSLFKNTKLVAQLKAKNSKFYYSEQE